MIKDVFLDSHIDLNKEWMYESEGVSIANESDVSETEIIVSVDELGQSNDVDLNKEWIYESEDVSNANESYLSETEIIVSVDELGQSNDVDLNKEWIYDPEDVSSANESNVSETEIIVSVDELGQSNDNIDWRLDAFISVFSVSAVMIMIVVNHCWSHKSIKFF